MAVKADEYREVDKEVSASDILTHIERGDSVNIDNCTIIGELNISKIKLKTIPNQIVYPTVYDTDDPELGGFYSPNYYEMMGSKESLRLIYSDIKIINSIFKDDTNFSYVIFNRSADFSRSKFNDSAYFRATTFNTDTEFRVATFNSSTDFGSATFNNSADFGGATFNSYLLFGSATFNKPSDFSNSKFKGSSYFTCSKFNDAVDFSYTIFNDFANFNSVTFNSSANRAVDFSYAVFNNSADFRASTFNAYTEFGGVTFNSSANFIGATFNDIARFRGEIFTNSDDFRAPDTSEKIITDGRACEIFRKSYRNEARYTDADNIYYNYRDAVRTEKSWDTPSKWFDTACWIACGYGLKPLYTLYSGGLLILLFSFIYITGPKIYLKSNNKIPFRFKWQGPIIYRQVDAAEEDLKVTYWDALYFSIIRFTNVGSIEWNTKDRIWSTFEGLAGWIMLGIFMATLTKVIIDLNI